MESTYNLNGKIALITGASSGLGVQFARALASHGVKVALAARRLDKVKMLEEDIHSHGGEAAAFQLDVTRSEEVKGVIEHIIARFGRIDILVNNAGVSEIAPAESMTDDAWKKVIDTNLTAVFSVTREVGKTMIANSYGKIINISSMYGVVANSAFPVVNYHASKFGVVGITKALAAEWAKYSITVNAIGPGFFESEMTSAAIHTEDFTKYVEAFCPMRRIGKAGELDGALLFLASDQSSYVTGQIICVDGGWTSI